MALSSSNNIPNGGDDVNPGKRAFVGSGCGREGVEEGVLRKRRGVKRIPKGKTRPKENTNDFPKNKTRVVGIGTSEVEA